MTTGMYKKGVAHIMGLTTPVDLDTDTICIALARTSSYTHNHDTDEFLSSVTGFFGNSGNSVLGTDLPAITGKTVQGGSGSVPGVFSGAATTTFTTVPAGAAIDLLVVFKSLGAGNAATSPVLAIYAVSVTPNGSDITVTWPTDTNGIFRLVAGTGV